MLVLSRRRSESIVISGQIIITVLEIRGNEVRVGVDAPAEVPVHRQEIADAIIALRKEESRVSCLNSSTLLVVSSDRRTRSALASIIAGNGGNVDTASSSVCALEYVDEREYDVAIIDESLESNGAQELFEKMREYQSGLKGILCSEEPTVDTVEAALDSGMEHVMQKPIDQGELISLVSN